MKVERITLAQLMHLNQNGELEVMVIGGYSTETLEVRPSSEVLISSKMQNWELGPDFTQSIDKTFECCVSKFNLCDWRVE